MDKHLSESNSARTGFTRAGVLITIVCVLVPLGVIIPVLVVAGRRASDQALLVACRENLRKIGLGLQAYQRDNGGVLSCAASISNPHPELVRSLVPKYLGDAGVFYCPAEKDPALVDSPQNLRAGVIGYFYYSASGPGDDSDLSKFLRTGLSWPRALGAKSDPKAWVASDIWLSGEPTSHARYKKGVNYLMLGGAVDFVTESPRHAFH